MSRIRTFLDRHFELVATVLLAAAAVATAWAAYQSARWHGEQAKAQSASIAAPVESTRPANHGKPHTHKDQAPPPPKKKPAAPPPPHTQQP